MGGGGYVGFLCYVAIFPAIDSVFVYRLPTVLVVVVVASTA